MSNADIIFIGICLGWVLLGAAWFVRNEIRTKYPPSGWALMLLLLCIICGPVCWTSGIGSKET